MRGCTDSGGGVIEWVKKNNAVRTQMRTYHEPCASCRFVYHGFLRVQDYEAGPRRYDVSLILADGKMNTSITLIVNIAGTCTLAPPRHVTPSY